MTYPCLSLHRVSYDDLTRSFCAEAQYVDALGIHRLLVHWHGPLTAEFNRIASGLRDAAHHFI